MSAIYKIKFKIGDTVVVRSGKDKGKTGKITSILAKDNKVIVEGVNIAKKHLKPNKQHPQGGITDITRPIFVSKLAILEPTSKKPSKIGYKLTEKEGKVRIYKSTGKEIKL